jgi:hypothetical protein
VCGCQCNFYGLWYKFGEVFGGGFTYARLVRPPHQSRCTASRLMLLLSCYLRVLKLQGWVGGLWGYQGYIREHEAQGVKVKKNKRGTEKSDPMIRTLHLDAEERGSVVPALFSLSWKLLPAQSAESGGRKPFRVCQSSNRSNRRQQPAARLLILLLLQK